MGGGHSLLRPGTRYSLGIWLKGSAYSTGRPVPAKRGPVSGQRDSVVGSQGPVEPCLVGPQGSGFSSRASVLGTNHSPKFPSASRGEVGIAYHPQSLQTQREASIKRQEMKKNLQSN